MKFIKNGMMLNFSQIIILFTSLLFQILLVNLFNVHEVGEISSLIALTNILSNLFCFGISNFIISKFYNGFDELIHYTQVLKKYIGISFVLSLLLYLTISFEITKSHMYAIYFTPILFCLTLVSVYISFLQIKSKFFLMSIFIIIVPLIKLISLSLGYFFNNKNIFPMILFILSLCFFVYLSLMVYQIFNKSGNKNVKFIVFCKEVFPYGILNLSFLIYTNASIVILGVMGLQHFSAYLSTTYLIINSIIMIPNMLVQKVFGVKIRKYIEEKNEFIFDLRKKAAKYLVLYFILILVIYYLIGKPIFFILFNNQADNILFTFNYFLISIFFRLVNILNGEITASIQFVKTRVKAEIFMSIILIISIFLISFTKNYIYILTLLIFIDIIWSFIYSILARRVLKINWDNKR